MVAAASRQQLHYKRWPAVDLHGVKDAHDVRMTYRGEHFSLSHESRPNDRVGGQMRMQNLDRDLNAPVHGPEYRTRLAAAYPLID
jgi:hypothetical protein